jgi:putative ABC transport system permease protein
MSLWRQITRGLRVLTARRAADQDVDDEIAHYLEQAAAGYEASGLSREEARRAARREVGNATVARETVRAYGWENAVGALGADLRYAARRLRNDRGFTVVAVLTLALGIGAATAIFSAVNPILFEPLPYRDARRIVMISDHGVDGSSIDVTFGTFRELQARSRSFDAIAVTRPWQPTMSGPAEPERWDGQRVSAEYFRALGVAPAIGRDFQASDDRVRGPKLVILGNGLWRSRFGGDPAIIGRAVTLDGDLYTVIGVMPRAFENVLLPSAELWTPLQYDASLPSFDGREWGHHLRMVARLAPGVGAARASRDIDRIAHARVAEFVRPPWATFEQGMIVRSLQDDVTSAARPALLAVLGAVLLVLVIACVNVTNLLLARGAQRKGEFALRAALGAARARMIRQLLTESLLLALVGGALGLAVAEIGVRALVALGPPELPRLGTIRIDGAVLAFALGITTLIGVLVGLVPALQVSRSGVHAGMQQVSRRTVGGHQLTRRALVVAEVALALVLLVSAGLLLRSLQRLFAVPPGFDAEHLVTMQVHAVGHRYDDDGSRYRFFSRALDEVRRVPGVAAAAFTSQLPLSGEVDGYGVHLEQPSRLAPDGDGSALRYAVSPGYLRAMRIPLLRGRALDEHDAAGAPMVVLVSESFARHMFPEQDAIGRRFRFGGDTTWATIVGIVGDVKQASLAMSQTDAVYVATEQWSWVDNRLSLVVRARDDAAALAPAIRRAIWSVDRDQPIVRVATMEDLVAASGAERRFALVVFEAFALAALMLAAIGLYGVLASAVRERTREIGVRMAMGATPERVRREVLSGALGMWGAGALAGLAGALATSRLLGSLLYEVSPFDPVAIVGACALLLAVALVAAYVPARSATTVDPALALRAAD